MNELQNLRAFIIIETAKLRIESNTSDELLRIVDKLIEYKINENKQA